MMLNFTNSIPICWLQSFQKKKMWCGLIFLGGLLLPSIALASYAAKIDNPNDGYLIHLDSDSSIVSAPVFGSDGNHYYRVGSPIVVNKTGSSVSVTGMVNCIGRRWGGTSTNIGGENSYHKLFIYAPVAGVTIDGRTGYRINRNVVMTVDSKMLDWVQIPYSEACARAEPREMFPVSSFTVQFPIVVTFYINERIIDGQVIITSMPLGGYVRAFVDPKVPPTDMYWSIGGSTVPMRLLSSTLKVDSFCSTTTTTGYAGTVNLRHGQLNTLNYDSVVTEKVTYTCRFSIPTKVKLRLDYVTDSDPQKRLPMTSSLYSEDKIYSDLSMTDETTGQTGKELKIDIKDLRTIKITSHIQGSNAVEGVYKGSAWLIATFD